MMNFDSKGFLTVKSIYGVPVVLNPVPTTTKEYGYTKVTNKKYIVIHNDGNLKADEKANAEFMKQDDNVLWHFTVGKTIVQGLSINRSGFHAGDGECGAGNLYGIGIEIDDNEEAAYNAIKLCKFLSDESPFGKLELKPHQYFSPKKKYCPWWIFKNWGWDGFIQRYKEFENSLILVIEPPYVKTLKDCGANVDMWVNFVEEMRSHPTGKWLPQLIEKVGAK